MLCLQDYVSDWNPEETVRRMQRGKVRRIKRQTCVSKESFKSVQSILASAIIIALSLVSGMGNVNYSKFIQALVGCVKVIVSPHPAFFVGFFCLQNLLFLNFVGLAVLASLLPELTQTNTHRHTLTHKKSKTKPQADANAAMLHVSCRPTHWRGSARSRTKCFCWMRLWVPMMATS